MRRPTIQVPAGFGAALSRAGRQAGRKRAMLLPLLTLPLLPAALFALVSGQGRALGGLAAAAAIAWVAGRALARGRRRSAMRAAVLMGVSAGLAALLAAKLGVTGAVVMGFLAWGGTRLLLNGVDAAESEAEAEIQAQADAAATAAARATAAAQRAEDAIPTALRDAEARLVRIDAAARTLRDSRLLLASEAMHAVVGALLERPDRLPAARRFLAVQLEGLERVVGGLAAGATPPPGLPVLLDDMRAAADRLREDLRRAADEELDIQVRVLSTRLREEGYA
ncbi:hypothetical protein ACQW02_13895 [Humitalea sp. 24SJ18S-53]|uniref:hypothetical protein n=1 Tax=Humitalea sp. 24SJ18S-53 TaxID=3422307 RepID=UPI003D670B0F